MSNQVVQLIFVTDCGGTDRGRYEIATNRCFGSSPYQIAFFETSSLSTLHAGFVAAAHALSTVDHFGELHDDEKIGLLVNAAPRYGKQNGNDLRGKNRHKDGEDIFALQLDNGVWVVGPNAGLNFYFLQDRIVKSFLVKDTSGMDTPFRSMEVMVPTLAKVLEIESFPNIDLIDSEKPKIIQPKPGVFIADKDSHGNLYFFSSIDEKEWLPELGQEIVMKIGNQIIRPRRVDGIFAGNTGEQTLTTGSLKLGGQNINYLVVVGSDIYSQLHNPVIGTQVHFEQG